MRSFELIELPRFKPLFIFGEVQLLPSNPDQIESAVYSGFSKMTLHTTESQALKPYP